MDTSEKFEVLNTYLKSLESVAVAFSGGVDSSFLLKVAFDALGEKVLAVTAHSASYPEREFEEAVAFTQTYGIRHKIIVSEELEVAGFSENPVNRCYLCKKELYAKISTIAQENGLKYVIEGSNVDDLADFRPGLLAVAEFDVKSPLREAFLTKAEIRLLSRKLELPTWNKPAFACLSSRFPYGEQITVEKLKMVETAEQILFDLGFKQARVRHHGQIARIEIEEKEFFKLLSPETKKMLYAEFNKLGFLYTTLDLLGYRTGSMNEGLQKQG